MNPKTVVIKRPKEQFPWVIGRRFPSGKVYRLGSYLTWAKAMEIAHTINQFQMVGSK